ncbi:MAG: glycosyltransferase family 4 protein [Clostridiales bacterium]|nr:glycosyltransferase family 4 protein [Clostridiales bacterium]
MSNSIEKIRIVEMIDRPSLGGGQRAVLLLASHLDRQQFEVFTSSAGEGPLEEEARKLGLAHVRVSLAKKFSPGAVREIAGLLQEYRVSILHTHGGIAGFSGRLAARQAQTPVVVHTLHGIHYLHYRNPLLRKLYVLLERKFSRFTDGLVLVSQADFQKARKHRLAAESKMFVIINGIDPPPGLSEQRIREKRLALGWPPDEPLVGTVARLHRQKGVPTLLEAAPRLFAAAPRARVVVVGEGPLGRTLRRKARRQSLEEKFIFLGERKDAAELLSLFDVFVLPSLWEGLPFILIEAASQRKPIVATAVDGITEVVENGKTGLLVPPENPQALADAIITIIQDRQKAFRLAANACSIIPPRFPLRRMVEQTQNLYLDLWRRKLYVQAFH